MKPVSASTEQALRAALTRLVSGMPVRTDGRLTVANLAREAGVSRAAANRAPAVLVELRMAMAATPARPRATRSRSTKNAEERARREQDNVIAQHVQVRALLQRADEARIGKIVSLRSVNGGA